MAYPSQSRHMSCAKDCKPLILLNTGGTRFCLGWHKISSKMRDSCSYKGSLSMWLCSYNSSSS